MKKKNGFTLIELLAVIVILAIIALIAVPIIMNVINEAKKGAAKDSMYGYVEAIELENAKKMISNENLLDGVYQTKDGNLYKDSNKVLDVNFKGTRPNDGGSVTITAGRVGNAILIFDGFEVTYNGNVAIVSGEEQKEEEEEKETLCTKASGVNLDNLTYGNQFTCELGDGIDRTFYLLEQNGDQISLLMNENIGDNIEWVRKEDYVKDGGSETDWNNGIKNTRGAITANRYLKEQTSDWTKLQSNQISLPTPMQLFNGSFSESIIGGILPWLYENTDGNPSYGYWTSMPVSDETLHAWYIFNEGDAYGVISYNQCDIDSACMGVRPVITIVKGNLQ